MGSRLIFLVILVVLIGGCIGKEDASEPELLLTCIQPYVLIGNNCCLDNDSNGVCDDDGGGEVVKPVVVEDTIFTEARKRMVSNDLEARDISDKKVLEAMGIVPRQGFVPENVRDSAYADHPLPIGYGQTISQPYVVALMTQSLELESSDKVLEIGTGSGYQAAILAEIVDEVYTIEIIEPLALRANTTLGRLGYNNVEVKNADGYFGWGEHAPFDAIMVTAAVDHIPPPLIEQLADGGRLILPLGSTKYFQTLALVEKRNDTLETSYITSVRFVPMTGEALKKKG